MDIIHSNGLKLTNITLNQTIPANATLIADKNIAQIVVGVIILLTITCVTSVGNILVIWSIFTYRPLKKVQNFFLVSLACADLCVAMLVMPFHIAKLIMSRWVFGLVMCQLWITSDIFLCTASILNLCAIALDRYWAITDPINYANRRTKQLVLQMLAAVWVLSFMISVPPLLGWNDWSQKRLLTNCEYTTNPGFVVYSACGSFYIPLIIMTTVYIKIFIAARQRLMRHNSTIRRGLQLVQKTVQEPLTVGRRDEPAREIQPMLSIDAKPTSSSTKEARLKSISGDSGYVPNPEGLNPNGQRVSLVTPVCVHCDIDRECQVALLSDTSDPSGGTPKIDHAEMNQPNIRPRQVTRFADHQLDIGSADNNQDGIDPPPYSPSPVTPRRLFQHPSFTSVKSIPRNIANFKLGSFSSRSSSQRRRSRTNIFRRLRGGAVSNISGVENVLVNPDADGDLDCEGGANASMRTFFKEKEKISISKEKKAAKTLAIIMGVFVICWLPFFILYVTAPFVDDGFINPVLFEVTNWLGYINSSLNPVIYTIFNTDFRAAFSRLLYCRKLLRTQMN